MNWTKEKKSNSATHISYLISLSSSLSFLHWPDLVIEKKPTKANLKNTWFDAKKEIIRNEDRTRWSFNFAASAENATIANGLALSIRIINGFCWRWAVSRHAELWAIISHYIIKIECSHRLAVIIGVWSVDDWCGRFDWMQNNIGHCMSPKNAHTKCAPSAYCSRKRQPFGRHKSTTQNKKKINKVDCKLCKTGLTYSTIFRHFRSRTCVACTFFPLDIIVFLLFWKCSSCILRRLTDCLYLPIHISRCTPGTTNTHSTAHFALSY